MHKKVQNYNEKCFKQYLMSYISAIESQMIFYKQFLKHIKDNN